MIVREREPENLEMPFSALDGFVTPNERFYVRDHFARPLLDPARWRLRVEGAVERPLELGLAEMLALPSVTRAATLECAGNARSFLSPGTPGVAWGLGAVGTAEWTGAPLRELLARAGVRGDAVDVVFVGADEGEIGGQPSSPVGSQPYARGVPIAKALSPEPLLAHRMNGVALPPAHGFPLRLVVPGWYAMASVKWLTRIVVTDRPFHGFFQTVDYAHWERRDGLPPQRAPIGEMRVKAAIARPAPHETVAAGAPYRMHGAAWSGDAPVVGVEVSTDGGKAWAAARLLGEPARHAWRLWEHEWVPFRAGAATLLARATDAAGNRQPMEREADSQGYMVDHVLPIAVEVAAAAAG